MEEAVEHIYKHYGDDEAAADRVRRGEEYRAAPIQSSAAPRFVGAEQFTLCESQDRAA